LFEKIEENFPFSALGAPQNHPPKRAKFYGCKSVVAHRTEGTRGAYPEIYGK
jgi:hypothetical protein